MIPKYTTRKRHDGLGGQLHTLALLLCFAEKYDLFVICDMRSWPYFAKDNKTLLNDQAAQDSILFHPRLVCDIDHIDSIPNSNILDWNDMALHHSIIEWCTGGIPSSFNLMHKTWMEVKNNRDAATPSRPDVDRGPRLLPRQLKLPAVIKDRSIIDKYKPRVQNSVTVHARLGNGELAVEYRNTTGTWLSESRYNHQKHRLSTDREQFIEEMKKHDDCSFFICTDELSFFEQCKDIFGDRAFSIDREWLPPGWGPGHNISQRDYPKHIKQEWKDNRSDPWKQICTDLTDMELMCYSKHMICNLSQFNFFGRCYQQCTVIKPIQYKNKYQK